MKHVFAERASTVLRSGIKLTVEGIMDAAFMAVSKLWFLLLDSALKGRRRKTLLLSLRRKATVMNVSDPIVFGHCVQVFSQICFCTEGP